MLVIKQYRQRSKRWHLTTAILAYVAVMLCACAAASRQPDAAQPRSNVPAYPVLLAASEERRDRALAAWAALTGRDPSAPPLIELHPVTATVRQLLLPATTAPPSPPLLQLPRVGFPATAQSGVNASEEETREALRRFIDAAGPLLGVEASNLSLVNVTDAAENTKKARYQQHPFVYPLRGGYGIVEITFTNDNRVVGLSSTAIPEAERLSLALAALRQRDATPEQAAAHLLNRPFAYTDPSGRQQTYTATTPAEITVRELVVYPVERRAGGGAGNGANSSTSSSNGGDGGAHNNVNDQAALELHLAWEIAVTTAAAGGGAGGSQTPLLIYLDALTSRPVMLLPAKEL